MAFQIHLPRLLQILDRQVHHTCLPADQPPSPLWLSGVSTDSRTIKAGELFIALRGETFDGHEFLTAALEKGAAAVLVDSAFNLTDWRTRSPQTAPSCCLIQVENSLKAYQTLAQWWRQQFTIPVIAVTGSVGKTTTKELIAAVLSSQGTVLKNHANFNNEIGLPRTLLELGPEHRYAVVEMGMRGQGEIAELTRIAAPTIAVITNVGTAHIGRLGSEQAIAEAKCELLQEMPVDGVAILNAENSRLMQTAAQVWSGRVIRYGLTTGDLRGEYQMASPAQPEDLPQDRLVVAGHSFVLPFPGRHQALNFLAALAVAKVLHLDWANLTTGWERRGVLDMPTGRAQRHGLPGDIEVLDETYNAGLESMLASLELLAQTPGKRHIAVLGTMRELGDYSIPLHQQVGQKVRHLQLDRLLILAEPAEAAAMAAEASPVVSEVFDHPDAVVQRLLEIVKPGDRLLFKASRTVALEQVVQKFCRDRSQDG